MATLNGTVVLFGGSYSDSSTSYTLVDTYAWNGLLWTNLNVVGPASAGKMATLNGKIVMSRSSAQATWTWDGAAWVNPSVTSPPSRSSYSMADAGQTVLLFGGDGGLFSNYLDDTWLWDGTGAAWVQSSGGGPPGRFSSAMATLQ